MFVDFLGKSDVMPMCHSLFEIVVDDYGTGTKGVTVFIRCCICTDYMII